MKSSMAEFMAEALELPPALRAYVAQVLIESIDAPTEPALSDEWQAEVARRCAELDRGMAELKDAEGVFAAAFGAIA